MSCLLHMFLWWGCAGSLFWWFYIHIHPMALGDQESSVSAGCVHHRLSLAANASLSSGGWIPATFPRLSFYWLECFACVSRLSRPRHLAARSNPTRSSALLRRAPACLWHPPAQGWNLSALVMTRIAPLEVKLRACDLQRQRMFPSALKGNLTELQGYFGGTGRTSGWVLQEMILEACWIVEWCETSAAPPSVYMSVPAAPLELSSFVYLCSFRAFE